ncbi:MAG: flagellar biosynthetic protein FliO, partial [Actinomycetia bacterium]|nr:flagellar biosynthetic protein FliO [Actinomycetes bacterium]
MKYTERTIGYPVFYLLKGLRAGYHKFIFIFLILLISGSLLYGDNDKKSESIKQNGKSKALVSAATNDDSFYSEYSAPVVKDEFSFGSLFFRTIFILLVLIGFFFFIFRYLDKKKLFPGADDTIKLLTTFPISGNKYLQIVNVSGKILLLGITDNSINLLTEITDKEVIDIVKLKAGSRDIPLTFTDKLQSLLGGYNIPFLKP